MKTDKLTAISKASDEIIAQAAHMIITDAGASMEMLLDRLLTYSAAQAVHVSGSEHTAAMFRLMADRIEGGIFAKIERGDQPSH